MFQFIACWEPLVPEEVPISDPEIAPNIWVPTVPSDEYNGAVKIKVKFAHDFYRPQFHKVKKLPYLCEK